MTVLLFWGLVSPRGQWRALMGWSMSDPHGNEPSTTSYVIRQFAFLVGLGGIAFVGVSTYLTYLDRLPKPPVPLTPVEQMWGSPVPDIVNRVVVPLDAPPVDLVDTPILGYQEAHPDDGMPEYVGELDEFARLGETRISGIIGQAPAQQFSAADTAELLVHVRGDLLCIPREAVVIETETTVQIAIYIGLPESGSETPQDHLSACQAEPPIGNSLLIPIELQAAVGERDVQLLDGTHIPRVRVIR
jgi:hypothetical protein